MIIPLFLFVGLQTGCVSYRKAEQFPAHNAPVAVSVGQDMPGKTQLLTGVYKDEDARVILTGHQGGSSVGMFFGVVGVLAQDAINTSSGRSGYSDAIAQLKLRWQTVFESLVKDELASGQHRSFKFVQDSEELVISPYAVFTAKEILDEITIRAYVVCEVELFDDEQESLWKTTCFIPALGKYPMDDEGLLENPTQVRTDMRSAAKILIDVIFRIVDGEYPPKELRDVEFESAYLWPTWPQEAEILGTVGNYTVLRMHISDALHVSGYQLVPTGDLYVHGQDTPSSK